MDNNQKSTDTKDNRARNWCAVIYPDSVIGNWRDVLDSYHLRWCESPLHDKDKNPNGEPKKPHIHIILVFDGKKSYEQVKAIMDAIHAPIPQRCHDMRGAVRYMAHLDNPEKYQYDPSGIIAHGGFDLKAYLKATAGERYQCISDMMTWCRDNKIIEIQDLLDYARTERFDDWFALLCDNSIMVLEYYLKSARHRAPNYIDDDDESIQ